MSNCSPISCCNCTNASSFGQASSGLRKEDKRIAVSLWCQFELSQILNFSSASCITVNTKLQSGRSGRMMATIKVQEFPMYR